MVKKIWLLLCLSSPVACLQSIESDLSSNFQKTNDPSFHAAGSVHTTLADIERQAIEITKTLNLRGGYPDSVYVEQARRF